MSVGSWSDDGLDGHEDCISPELYQEKEDEVLSAFRVLRHAHTTLKEAKANPEKEGTFIDSVLENVRWWLDQNVPKQPGETWETALSRIFDLSK